MGSLSVAETLRSNSAPDVSFPAQRRNANGIAGLIGDARKVEVRRPICCSQMSDFAYIKKVLMSARSLHGLVKTTNDVVVGAR